MKEPSMSVGAVSRRAHTASSPTSRKHAQQLLLALYKSRPKMLVKYKRDPFIGIPASRRFSVAGQQFAVTSDDIVGRGARGYYSLGAPTKALLAELPRLTQAS